jgi:phosphatidylinositol phospholipase C beta
MNKGHLEAQDDLLKSSMLAAQATQLKELDAIFERDNKEMKSTQAKTSVETARDVQADKSLKTKAEKERIIREKNANNTKRFIDERKSQAIKQSHRREKLKKEHAKQMGSLQKYLDNRVEMAKSEERESQLAQRTECFV